MYHFLETITISVEFGLRLLVKIFTEILPNFSTLNFYVKYSSPFSSYSALVSPSKQKLWFQFPLKTTYFVIKIWNKVCYNDRYLEDFNTLLLNNNYSSHLPIHSPCPVRQILIHSFVRVWPKFLCPSLPNKFNLWYGL